MIDELKSISTKLSEDMSPLEKRSIYINTAIAIISLVLTIVTGFLAYLAFIDRDQIDTLHNIVEKNNVQIEKLNTIAENNQATIGELKKIAVGNDALINQMVLQNGQLQRQTSILGGDSKILLSQREITYGNELQELSLSIDSLRVRVGRIWLKKPINKKDLNSNWWDLISSVRSFRDLMRNSYFFVRRYDIVEKSDTISTKLGLYDIRWIYSPGATFYSGNRLSTEEFENLSVTSETINEEFQTYNEILEIFIYFLLDCSKAIKDERYEILERLKKTDYAHDINHGKVR